MRICAVLVIAVFATVPAAPAQKSSAQNSSVQNAAKDFEPLMAYAGTWQVSRAGAPKPETLINKCEVLGEFFACAQNVDGQAGPLVVFLRHGEPGHYQVQNIMPSGRATGLTELQLTGNTWTYFNRQSENGVATYYKTTNVFSGKNKIHFESSHSSNNKDFTVDASGDEVKVVK